MGRIYQLQGENLCSILTPITHVELKKRGKTYTLVIHRGEDVTIQGLGESLHHALAMWNQAASNASNECREAM